MLRLDRILVLGLALGCASNMASGPGVAPDAQPDAPSTAEVSRAPVGQPARSAAPANEPVVFYGMCDASGAVPLSNSLFAVANDEDNVLRVYDADRGGAPLWQRDISKSLTLPQKPNKKPPETDIEAAARVGDVALWITSHGRNSSGKLKSERLRLFGTTAPAEGKNLEVIGSPSGNLLDALFADARYAAFGLQAAAALAPKAEGGLNIEGMTERREGGVWIGFRNPVPGGKALLVPLLNPTEMLHGAAAKLGDPELLDLAGLGVRSLSSWHGKYLIVAGHYDDAGVPSRMYRWDGADQVTQLAVSLAGWNPEGFFTPEDRDKLLLLNDDGSALIDGVPCKKLKDPAKKQFRGRWIAP